MRLLLVLPLKSLVRHIESVLVALADRGHTIRLVTPAGHDHLQWPDVLVKHPRISTGICPEERSDAWKTAAKNFRLLVDYTRFLDGPLSDAEKLRQRAFKTFLRFVTDNQLRHAVGNCPTCGSKIADDQLGKMLLAFGDAGLENMRELMHLIEGSIPSDPGREAYLKAERPDVILVTPLVGLEDDQADWVKSARALGIPVGFPVFSWDNLTTKGIVRVQPDRVFVWNEVQKQEAIEYHDIPAEHIDITGAPRFDAFFDLAPAAAREKLCKGLDLDPERPIITYLCSSPFIAEREVDFVPRWLEEIRREPTLASCSVLIRPHPRTIRQWKDVDVSGWGNAALVTSPKLNADRVLYNTLANSEAVVGLNTSAQLEAGILGKPVFTILAPEFERGQQGTPHFRYLLREEGGFVEVAKDFDEHRRQLAEAVAGRYDAERIREFVKRFIRPDGLERPATSVLVEAIERLAPSTPKATVKRWLASAGRR